MQKVNVKEEKGGSQGQNPSNSKNRGSTDGRGNWGKYHSACSGIKRSRKKSMYYQNKKKNYAIIHIKIFISVYNILKNGFSEPLWGEEYESLCKAVQNQSKPPPKALK